MGAKSIFHVTTTAAVALLLGGMVAVAQAQPPGFTTGPPPDGGVGVSVDVETIEPIAADEGLERVIYSAKFVCGTIRGNPRNPQFPAQFTNQRHLLVPGTYLSAINIFNPNAQDVNIRKKAVIAVPQRQGEPGKPGQVQKEFLPPYGALEVDCIDILRLLNQNPAELQERVIKGFVVVEIDVPLRLGVTAVHTLKNVD